MPEASARVRSGSFGAVADAYDQYRPSPPVAAVDWLLGGAGDPFCDLAAGTGHLTRKLAARAPGRVLAVEPDPRMVAVLVGRPPWPPVVRGRGETLPLADSSIGALTVSAAWHWMDPAPTFAEIARVVRPGGVFGVLGTGPNREVDWVGALFDASRRPHGEATDRSRTHAPDLPPDAPFTEPEATVFEYTTPMTRAELVGLAGTYSSVITLPDDERERHLADIDRAVRAALGGTGAPDDATAEVPLRCRCWRTVRR